MPMTTILTDQHHVYAALRDGTYVRVTPARQDWRDAEAAERTDD